MSRSTTLPEAVQGPLLVSDQRDEGAVDVVEDVVDDLVLLLEPRHDRRRVGVVPPQVREDRGVLEAVVPGDDPAVGLTVGAEAPVVLPHGHVVDGRPRRAGREVAAHHLVDDVAQLGELAAQVVVHVDEVLRRRELLGVVRRLLVGARSHRIGGSGRLVPGQHPGEPGAVVGGRHDDRAWGCRRRHRRWWSRRLRGGWRRLPRGGRRGIRLVGGSTSSLMSPGSTMSRGSPGPSVSPGLPSPVQAWPLAARARPPRGPARGARPPHRTGARRRGRRWRGCTSTSPPRG